MPESRLDRTRHGPPDVPACIRLDHFWVVDIRADTLTCRRCGLQKDARWGTILRPGGMDEPEESGYGPGV